MHIHDHQCHAIQPIKLVTIQRTILANIIRRWMKGLPLDDRETSIVEAILQINAADQFIRCSEG